MRTQRQQRVTSSCWERVRASYGRHRPTAAMRTGTVFTSCSPARSASGLAVSTQWTRRMMVRVHLYRTWLLATGFSPPQAPSSPYTVPSYEHTALLLAVGSLYFTRTTLVLSFMLNAIHLQCDAAGRTLPRAHPIMPWRMLSLTPFPSPPPALPPCRSLRPQRAAPGGERRALAARLLQVSHFSAGHTLDRHALRAPCSVSLLSSNRPCRRGSVANLSFWYRPYASFSNLCQPTTAACLPGHHPPSSHTLLPPPASMPSSTLPQHLRPGQRGGHHGARAAVHGADQGQLRIRGLRRRAGKHGS